MRRRAAHVARTPAGQQDIASHTPGPVAQLPPPQFSGRTDVAEEEIEELQQRVEELEATVAQLKSRESSRDALECRAKADSILSIGWKCFTLSASALALYGLHGTSARSLSFADIAQRRSVYMKRSKGMLRRMIYGFWVAGVLYQPGCSGLRRQPWWLGGTMSEAESEVAWDDCHKVHAIFMYESIVELQGWGCWTILEQSSRCHADTVPRTAQ